MISLVNFHAQRASTVPMRVAQNNVNFSAGPAQKQFGKVNFPQGDYNGLNAGDYGAKYNSTIEVTNGSVTTGAALISGGIIAGQNVTTTHPDLCITTGPLHTAITAGGSVETNARDLRSSIVAGKDIITTNSDLTIAVGDNGSLQDMPVLCSMRSYSGNVLTNADHVHGYIKADQGSIFIIGGVKINGTVKAPQGRVYLVNSPGTAYEAEIKDKLRDTPEDNLISITADQFRGLEQVGDEIADKFFPEQ